MSFSFNNLVEDCTKPHDFREIINRWGYILYKNLDNREIFLNRISVLTNEFNKNDFEKLIEDYEDFIEKINRSKIKAVERPLKKVKIKTYEPKSTKRVIPEEEKPDKESILSVVEKLGKMDDLTTEYIKYIYILSGRNKSETARILGMSVRTIRNYVV